MGVLGIIFCLLATAAALVEVRLHLQERNNGAMEETFQQVSDPHHERYGQFLSLDQIRDMVGVTEADFTSVRAWLTQQGARNISLSAARTHATAFMPRSTALSLEAANYHHGGPSAVKYAWVVASAATVQRVAAASIAKPLNRWEHLRAAMRNRDDVKLGDSDPNGLKDVMGIPTGVIAKSGNNSQMVWGTGTYGVQPEDLDYFWSLWEVKGQSAKLMTYQGTMGSSGDNYKEGCLDAEYLTGTGNGIKTTVANTDTSADAEEGLGYGRALLTFASDLSNAATIPNVLSLSIGSLSFASCDRMCKLIESEHPYDKCWTYLTTTQRQVCMFGSQAQTDAIDAAFMKLGVRGMSIFAASGDGGSHWAFGPFDNDGIGKALNTVGCSYNWPVYPAESPFVTAVGGTDVVDNQKPWVASGGGFSWTSAQPAWQSKQVSAYLAKATGNSIWPASSAMNVSNRGYPDVAAYAGEVPYVEKDSPGGLMGTSVACPVFAGVISLINDLRLQQGMPVLGFVNPRLYELASSHPGEAFQGMSSGSSRCDAGGDCCHTGYPVLGGWNPVTGLGWPLWKGLSQYLVAGP